MKNTYSLEIDAPIERVFAWVYESDRNKQWLPNLVESEVLVTVPEGKGSKFRQVYVENGRRMEMVGEVVGFERNRYLACALSGAAFGVDVDYRLEDLGRGRTRLTQTSEVRFGSPVMKIIGK